VINLMNFVASKTRVNSIY